MTKMVGFDRKGVKTIIDGLSRPIDNAKTFFDIIGLKLDQATQLTFRVLGGRNGRKAWVGYNRGQGHTLGGSTRMKSGTWRIRYGTDMKGVGSQGIKRAGARRYAGNSKMMQASGGFRQSFKIVKTTKDYVIYGTKLKIAEDIMDDPKRPVLFVTQKDRRMMLAQFLMFYQKGLRF